jgi:hypothetical protein
MKYEVKKKKYHNIINIYSENIINRQIKSLSFT